ncbi:MAG: type II secretion system F family protein [Alphaproteobacteria bacterium]
MNPIAILIALIVLILIATVAALVMTNQEKSRKAKALSIITGRNPQDFSKKNDKDEYNKRRAEIAKKLKESKDEAELGKKGKKKRTISLMIEQAGLGISVKQFWIFSVISMAVVLLIGKMFSVSPLMMCVMAIIGLLGVPKFVMHRLTQKRQKNFLQEFPDALEAMVRLLKAGMPVSEAVSMISREFEGPVGDEMMRIYDKQKIGVPLYEAAQEATRRMPLPEMQMFATGLTIQAQTGSSLSEVLMNLAGVIRARFRLKRKIKALSSEAIASASIIGALPVVVTLGLWFVNRDYIEVLFTDPFGKILMAGAVIWAGLGIFVMKIMINFKV